MNPELFTESRIMESLGWTLAHSVWQIAVVALVLFLLTRILANFSANLRYAVSVSALIIAFALPVITFYQLAADSAVKASSSKNAEEWSFEMQTGSTRRVEQYPASAQSGINVLTPQNGGMFAKITSLREFFARHFPTVLPFAVAFWLLGITLYSVRLLGGIRQLNQYKTCKISAPDNDLQERFDVLCEKLKIRQTVKLLRSHLVETPIVVGWLKPMIIMPASVLLQIDPRGLETILAHELIHIRRHDALVTIAQSTIEVLFFYHPGVWWISAQIRREREFATDAAVLEMFEDAPVIYARALATLEEIRRLTNQQTPRIATAANGGNLMQRIQKILQKNTEIRSASFAWSAVMALILIPAVLLAIFSFNPSNLVNAQARAGNRKVAIGFVSIPPLDRTENPPKDADATARLLIHALKLHKVPATGFLQGGMISDGEKLFPVRANIARMWRDAGFEIGLGGFKHINLYDTQVDHYIANIEKNERVVKQLLGDMGLPPRYFSYPFLNTGKTVDDKSKVEAWLATRGYTSVKYTIDNNEWMYSFGYDTARNDNDLNTMKEIRDAYLTYMMRMFDHYEKYTKEMFGRDISQTMVLTPSRLVTDTADDFFSMLEKRGYAFITVDEAQSDEAYKTREDFTGEAGISWFERWAIAAGKRPRDEPGIDQNVRRIWNENQSKTKK